MSQPDLIAHLQEARPVAPAELRERVRLIAAEAAVPPRRRITWRRAAVVLVPVAAAIVAGVILLPGNGRQAAIAPPQESADRAAPIAGNIDSSAARSRNEGSLSAGYAAKTVAPAVPAPSTTRLQRYGASLDLELRTSTALAAASRKAVAIAASLSGYQQTVVVRTEGKAGYAHLVLRVPTGNVREAIRRLSALGTITAENVSIQDLQVQVDTTARRIASLQRQLAALRAETQTPQIERRIAALTAQVQRLQRARAASLRAAHYATVELQLQTPAAAAPVRYKPGPLHGLGTAFRWIGIGAVYALAIGTPLAALVAAFWLGGRRIRRRREDRLLANG